MAGKEISTEWLHHLKNEDEKNEFKQLLQNSKRSLGRLKTIMKQREEQLINEATRPSDFDTAGWDTRQAYRLGRLNELQKIKELLGFI